MTTTAMLFRRTLLKSLPASLITVPIQGPAARLAREWTLHVPFPPGGSPDLLARVLADEARARTGASVVVLNTSGVNGELGLRRFLQQDPDGAHFLVAPDSLIVINPWVYHRPNADPLHGLEPLGAIAGAPQFLLVRTDDSIRSLTELAAAARDAPLDFGSGGVGGQPHLLMLQLAGRLGIRVHHVPYRTNGLAALGVASGETRAVIAGTSALGLVRSGRLRVIAVSTPQRLAAWPEVPTLAEDLPGFTALVWIGLFGTRSATPTANTELIEFARSTLSEAAVRDRIESTSGLQPLMI